MAVQTYTGTLIVEECCACHMGFGITRDFYDRRREDHGWFYCPAGHQQHYSGMSDTEKLRAELEVEKRRVASRTAQLDQARAEAEHNDRRVRGYQGALAKTKKRIAKGSCPACSTAFPNLAGHMAEAHPDYAPADG